MFILYDVLSEQLNSFCPHKSLKLDRTESVENMPLV